MNIDDLYSDLGVDFQPDDRKRFLHEFSDLAQNYIKDLGPSDEPQLRDIQLEELAEGIGKESVEFSPHLVAIPLGKNIFSKLKLDIPPYLASLFRRFDFHLLNIPITVVPRPGGGFVRLECIVAFNPDDPPAKRPLAYQIFPQEEWQQIIHAWQGVEIGLDENLEFKVDPIQAETKLPNLDLPVKAAVKTKMAGKAGLVLGPFNYDIRRSKIMSKGKGNVKVHWRMDGEDIILHEEPHLGVVLQVPKGSPRLEAIGVLSALPTAHFLTAHVRDVIENMSSAGKNFFNQGGPVTHRMPWGEIELCK